MKFLCKFMPVSIYLLLIFNAALSQTYKEYNDLAAKEYEKKDYHSLIRYADQSIRAQANGGGYWWRGMGRYYLNNFYDAYNDFSYALSYYSSDYKSLADLRYWMGLCKSKQKDYKAALSDYELSKSYGYEGKFDLYWEIAYSNYQLGNYTTAAEMYSTAANYTTDKSKLSKMYEGKANAFRKLYKNKEAIEAYTNAIASYPDNSNAYWSRALCRATLLDYAMAIEDCTSALNIIEKSPSPPQEDLSTLYNNRGLYKYYSKNYEDAKADLQKSLSFNPNYNLANRNMGDVLYSQKKYKEAISFYQRAASLYTENNQKTTCFSYMYWSARKLLDYNAALKYISLAIESSPTNLNYNIQKGYALEAKKDYTSAMNAYQAAINKFEAISAKSLFDSMDIAWAYKERALLKIKTKQFEGALEDFQKVLLLNPYQSELDYEMGRFYKQQLNQPEMATVYLSKAMRSSIRTDTGANYAYCKLFNNEKRDAYNFMERRVKSAREEKEKYKWELHNFTCIYALADDALNALKYLELSLKAGFDDWDHLHNDRDLLSIQKLPAYKALLLKYKVPQVVGM